MINITKITTHDISITSGDLRGKLSDGVAHDIRMNFFKEHCEKNKVTRNISLPPLGIQLPTNICSYLNERYSEFICKNPTQDINEYDLWNNTKRRFPFNSSYLPLEIKKKPRKGEGAPSFSALENIGSIVMGLLVEKSNSTHKPICRRVFKFPDLISLNMNNRKFVFHEAKASTTYKGPDIKPLYRQAVNEILAQVCDSVRIVISRLTAYNPIELEVDVYNIEDPNSKLNDYQAVLDSLTPTFETEMTFGNKGVNEVIEEIFPEDIASDILGNLNAQTQISEITEEIKNNKTDEKPKYRDEEFEAHDVQKEMDNILPVNIETQN